MAGRSENFIYLLEELISRGIYCREIPKTVLVEASDGQQRHILSQYTLPMVPYIYPKLIDNKKNFKVLLEYHHIPYVLPSKVFSPNELNAALDYVKKDLGFPVVCKEVHSNGSYLVFVGIHTEHDFIEIWQKNYANLSPEKEAIMVERYLPDSSDYRFFCFREHHPIVFKRIEPSVVADGISTIQELVEKENQLRMQAKPFMQLIVVGDVESERALRDQQLSLASVPPAGQKIRLRYGLNRLLGGWHEWVNIYTVHPEYWQIVQRVWDIFPKMPFFSLDFLSSRDLSVPPGNDTTAICESTVGPSGYVDSVTGRDRSLFVILADILFPGSRGKSGLQQISCAVAKPR